jgi:diguanylate cyclase (GGDEF)-like protein
MIAVEPLLAIAVAAMVALVALATLLMAALTGRGPLYGRFLEIDADARVAGRDARGRATRARREDRGFVRSSAAGPGSGRFADEELDEILRGSYAAEEFNRAVRVLAWSFILIVLLIVSLSQLWQPVQPQIFATLILAGIFVLVVHEILPVDSLARGRVLLEASAAIVFLTMLVMLTGNSSSPFFFLYALLVGGTALIASPTVTAALTLETAFAYAVAVLGGPVDAATSRDTFTRVAINLVALVLLAYSGMVIARVQRRTRDAAIRLSTVDPLTELYNRAFFFNSVDREIQRAQRFGRGFCLLMMDLDGLKGINDQYGHYQGDVVLRGVAQVIRMDLRAIDVAARYGGDEFVALLPETDPSGAYVAAEKIRQTVTELLVEVDGRRISTSLSIGVVAYPDDGRTADELMIAADAAMYSSKRLGKNQVVGYAEPDGLSNPFVPQQARAPSTPGFRPLTREDRG